MSSDTVFRAFTPVQMLDNWWHVRKYFQAIELQLGKPIPVSLQTELMVVLAGLRAGIRQPLPLILLVDYVLRKIWKCLTIDAPAMPLLKALFDELTVFTYGTAINALVLRCKRTTNNADDIKVMTGFFIPLSIADHSFRLDGILSFARGILSAPTLTAPVPCQRRARSVHSISGPSVL